MASLLAGSGGSLLLGVQSTTGAATAKSGPGTAGYFVWGMTFDSNSDTLCGSCGTWLIRLDTTTGAGTSLGVPWFHVLNGLAFNPNTNRLYVAIGSGTLFTLDIAAGKETAVGALGFGDVQGLAFDSSTNTLYGTDATALLLLIIDTATGATGVVGPTGFAVIGLGERMQ